MGALGIDALQSQRLLVAHHHQHGYGFGSSGCGGINNNPNGSFSAAEAASAPPVVSFIAPGYGRGGCGTSSSSIHSSQVVRLPSSASATTSSPSLSPSRSASSASRQCSFTPPVVVARASSSSTRDRYSRTTTAFNWMFPNALSFSSSPSFCCSSSSSSTSSSSTGRWGRSKLSGNWDPCCCCCCCCSSNRSNAPNLDELVVVVTRRWRPTNTKEGKVLLLSVPTISTTPFRLWPTTREESENFVYKLLKVSASSIFSWLKNQRRRILEIIPHSRLSAPNPWHWGSSCGALVDRSLTFLPFASYSSSSPSTCLAGVVAKNIYIDEEGAYGFQRMWAIRATSDYCSGGSNGSSIGSSQAAEGGQAALSLEGRGGGALLAQQQQQRHHHQRRSPDSERGVGFLATGFGWRVRDAERGELRELIRVADIQSDAFHERSPLFDDLFSRIFHAEVLSSLQYKARNFDPNRYACLLAEMDTPEEDSMDEEGDEATIVGAVDITVLDDRNVLSHLPGADEYLYISGMAVDSDYRRQGVATLLLEACVARAMEWNFNYLVLHAYEDDFRARSLYSRAGYHIISADPAWMTKFLGRRRRVVMAKKIDEDGDDEVPDLDLT